MSYYVRIFAALASARPYWEKLKEVSENGIRTSSESLEFKIRRPKGENISVMGARRNDVKFKVEKADDEDLLVTLYDLVPYKTVTVFFD
jgi:hypothetical protein